MQNYFKKIAKNIKKKPQKKQATQIENAISLTDTSPINGGFQGYFDGILPTGELYGWAYNEIEPLQRLDIYLTLNDVIFGNTKADLKRYDLEKFGKADGCCAFVLSEIPFSALQELSPDSQIHAFFDSSLQTELVNSPLALTETTRQQLSICALNPQREDLTLDEQKIAVVKLLDILQHPAEAIDIKLLYSRLLGFCRLLLKFEQYEWLQQQLTLDLIQTQLNEGGFAFELMLLHTVACQAHNMLSLAQLQQLETALYAKLRGEYAIQEQSRFFYHDFIYEIIINSYRHSYLSLLKRTRVPTELTHRFLYLLGIALLNLYQDYSSASLLFDFIRRYADFADNALLLEYCGKANRLLDKNFEAMQDFTAAIQAKTESAMVYQEVASLTQLICEGDIHLLRQTSSDIFAFLLKSFQLNPHRNGKLQTLADDFLRQFFQSCIAQSALMAKKGAIKTALAARRNDLANLITTIDLLQVLAGQGCYQGAAGTRQVVKRCFQHILFIGSTDLWQCYQYRVVQKIEQAQTLGYETAYRDTNSLDDESWKTEMVFTDVIYICRVPVVLNVIKLISYAHQLQIPVIYDIDDYLFNECYFPAPLESYAGTIDQDLHTHLIMDNPFFEVALQLADYITCSTPPLAERIREVVGDKKTVVVHPNLLSPTLYQVARYANKAKKRHKNIQIFYGSATKAHKQVIYEVFGPALLVILQRYPLVQFTAFGYFQLPLELEPYADRIEFREPTANRDYYLSQLSMADINIAALEQDPFTDCKSEIKWLEAAVFGIPSIVTPTATYRAVTEEEKHVLFAHDAEQWEKQLSRLIESAEFRHNLGENARKHALEYYDPAVGAKILESSLNAATSVFQPALSTSTQKPRLLYVNVWFAPQSVGGATRVFESHVKCLLENYANKYELFILTSQINPEHYQPYSVEQFLYGSALVTRINVPLRDWSETCDETMAAFCEQFYQQYAFDLIHFHALPIITASVVDAARKLKIPYLITLHDGWWLSKYMFLVDELHSLIDTTQAFSERETCPRQQQLYACLNEASAVLAVSNQFRDIYQDAGITQTQTNENGVEIFEVLPRNPVTTTESVKVRVAHIGGMSYHKGFDLFKEAVSQGHFRHLEIHIIDHSLESGQVYQGQWGSTPVIFRAKLKQSEVNLLYANIDVLVAPSIWPESFGLVTREAAYAGVWVIASDRGAVGDCVEEGVNGRIVSVDNCLALQQALVEIETNPARYLSPCPQKTSRSVAEQVEECVSLYQTLLLKQKPFESFTDALK